MDQNSNDEPLLLSFPPNEIAGTRADPDDAEGGGDWEAPVILPFVRPTPPTRPAA